MSGDRLGHSRTLMCFFLRHSFVALAVCFGPCSNSHPKPIFNALTVQCPIHRPFDAVQLSCPLSRTTPQSIMFPPPCLTEGMCSWGHRQHSFSSKHGELSWCQRAGFWSHLTTTLSPSSPLNHWLQTSVHVLSWAAGPCMRCMVSVLHGVVCYELVPAALISLTRSSRVVLGWFLTASYLCSKITSLI